MGANVSKGGSQKNLKDAELTLFKQIVSLITDPSTPDDEIIKILKENYDKREKLVKRKEGGDELNILHLAVKNLRFKLTEYLIKNCEIDIGSITKRKQTVLHLLVQRCDKEFDQTTVDKIFTLLSKYAVNIDTDDIKGFYAIHYAAQFKTNFIVKKFSENGFKLDRRIKSKNYSLTPLQISCEKGKDSVTDFLVDKITLSEFNDPQSESAYFPLHLILKSSEEKKSLFFKLLKKYESLGKLKDVLAKTDMNLMPLMHIAIESGHKDIVADLFQEKYDINKEQKDGNGNKATHIAAKNGNTNILEILIKNQALSNSKNNKGETPMHVASFFNHDLFVKKLLDLENTGVIQIDGADEPSIRKMNMNDFTPLQVALASDNKECYKLLVADKNAKLYLVGSTSSSNVYHVCAEFSNERGFTDLMADHYSKEPALLTKQNADENTVLHLASRTGCFEIIKMTYEALSESQDLDKFIFLKNNRGENFFHIACKEGFLSIAEFFVKDLKRISLLEEIDNDGNTPIHLATIHGHEGLVNSLLEYMSDDMIRNHEKLTIFELSCKSGRSMISTNMISKKASLDIEDLHTACALGSTEVVELLLNRGVKIDELNSKNENCLIIAIQNGHENVIKILLETPDWKKLFRLTNESITQPDNFVEIINPEFKALYDNKMWDILELVLTKSCDPMDLSIIDRYCSSNGSHPLMYCARSGQENIIKHDAVLLLLKLKWRYIPRMVYYFNLLVSSIFLILSIALCFEIEANITTCKADNSTCGFDYTLFWAIVIIIALNGTKSLLEFLITDKIAYFQSYENWLEIITYVTSLIAMMTSDPIWKIEFGSIAVLSAFITYPLYLQKMRILGVYVVAVVKTLKNSLKFFPIFFIVLMGFVLNFYLRFDNGVTLSNSSDNNFAYIILKGMGMAFGDFSVGDDFGVQTTGLTVNWVIFLIFLILVCVVIFNLFVGIAVSDVTAVLGEADIRFLSMRIIFCLKMQTVVELLASKSSFFEKLSMNFSEWQEESPKMKALKEKKKSLFLRLTANEESVNLVDPQKNLENMFKKMFSTSSNDTENLEKLLKSKIEGLDFKISRSNRQIDSKITGLERAEANNYKSIMNFLEELNKRFEAMNTGSSVDITPIVQMRPSTAVNTQDKEQHKKLQNNINEKFSNIDEKMKIMQYKLEDEINELKYLLNDFVKKSEENMRSQTNEIQNALFLSESSIRTDLNETGKMIGTGFKFTKDSITFLDGKINNRNVNVNVRRESDYEERMPTIPVANSFDAVTIELPESSSAKLVPKEKKK